MPDGLPQIEKGTWLCYIYMSTLVLKFYSVQYALTAITSSRQEWCMVQKSFPFKGQIKIQKHSSRNGHRNCRQTQDKLFLLI